MSPRCEGKPNEQGFYDGAGGDSTTTVLVHNCSNLGTKVDWEDTNNPLVQAVHDRRVAEGDKSTKNYAAARLKSDQSIITGRAMGKGANGIHAEEDLINQAGGLDNISELYTERAPCAFKCDEPLRNSGVDVSYSYGWPLGSLAPRYTDTFSLVIVTMR
jgi:Xanthomonas XOO_2897-like deaminase